VAPISGEASTLSVLERRRANALGLPSAGNADIFVCLDNLFDSVAQLLTARWKTRNEPRRRRSFRCRCGRPVFFRNSQCLACGAPLGYEPRSGEVRAVETHPGDGTLRVVEGGDDAYKRCANFDSAAGCNWLVPAGHPSPYCIACRLNRTIPDLSDADNQRYWRAIEIAKRRLVSQLLALGLPVASKLDEDPARGLMFDFLRAPPDGSRVLTGHADGLITLNAEEADDAKRERIRHELREPYRTLLGHLRHEVGHYYWDRLVRDSGWLEPFRTLFGDERADYAAALRANYENGPPADWANRHISSYASTHPWEDWAETWAHYLHVVDSLDTALGYGLDADDLEAEIEPFTRESLYSPDDPDAERFLSLLNAWLEMTTVLNELARSMGQHDFYPFVMSRPVVKKLQFIHLIVARAHAGEPAPRP
jgi:hypothetical protein